MNFDLKDLEEQYNRSKFKRLFNNLLDSLKDIGYELDFLNLKENYFISLVLFGILWFLVSLYVFKGLWDRLVGSKKEQKHLPKDKRLTSTTEDDPYKTPRFDQEDDGHMSDSALSFFNTLRKEKGPRFRKRDKLAFYGKKMLRTVKDVKGTISENTAEKSAKFYKILTKKILNQNLDDSIPPLYRRTEPPSFLLDIESSTRNADHNLPTALINLIRSVKVFGYFDQKIILEMCKYMETKTVYANNYVFKIGNQDDSIYVVESGRVHVYITDEKGRKHMVKECVEGNHIFSMLSIMDVLIGETKSYKTVSAKAIEDTQILRLPGRAFQEVLQKYPDYLVRITQIIIVRLQRVTFTALHSYLGLTSEMMRMGDIKRKNKAKEKKSTRTHRSAGAGQESGHHHHHHHHHYHEKGESKVHRGMMKYAGSDSDFMNEYARQDSTKSGSLPPVSFFAQQSVAEESSDNISTLNGTEPKPTGLIKSVQSDMEKLASLDDQPHTEYNLPQDLKRNSLAIASDAAHIKQLSKLVMQSRENSEESAIESSEEESELGSEFGESHHNTYKIKSKLPQVKKDIAASLKINDPEVLEDKINITCVSEGTVICKEGDYNCSLVFVLDGQLCATQRELDGQESTIFYATNGQFCVNLSVLSGEPAMFSISAKEDTELAIISKENFNKIIAIQPTVALSVAWLIVSRMSPFVRQIDFALEWNLVEAGNALFRQNNKAENIFIVLNGRLRSILKNEGKKQLVGEYGRGDLVGIVEILMETDNATTVVAIRDTEVAQIPSGLLNYIKYRHPRVVTRLIQMLSSKLLGTIRNTPSTPLDQPIDAPTIVSNLCTVAIMPVSDDVPLTAFTMKLCHALNAIDNTLILTKDLIIRQLGQTALEPVNEYRLCAWLGQQEDHHRIVLYQCESRLTRWTRRCMRQADCLLTVGLASNPPTVGQLEKEIDNFAIRAQKELILLHRMDGSRPKNTVNWLNCRSWCTSHHHIRCPDNLFKTFTERGLRNFEEKLKDEAVNKMTDFSRLARFLTSTSIGVVLGGGGARGSAHVGMIKSMIEAGIPIDMIGGTSIGSFMGGLWADENNYDGFHDRARDWSQKMTSIYNQVMDITYPVTSMFTGSGFNNSIEDVFGNKQIEDLWIPYFCITTDISASKMRIHMNGSLWRYIRSSMSLSGYLPPLCDPIDGHLLLDGGYTNNLPADVMHRMGVNTVLAIDVGAQDDDNFTNYGDQLSGWWLLWKKWNYWSTPIKIPDLTEIQSRLAYVSCQRILETVKKSDYCEYMRPPIDKYRTLQFGHFAEIKECGYNYGKILFDTWIKHAGSIEKFLYKKTNKPLNNALKKSKIVSTEKSYKPGDRKPNDPTKRFNTASSNYHFEDLSQFVCQQPAIKTVDITDQKKSILKKDSDLKQIPRYKHSKSVQLNNEDNIYDQIYDILASGSAPHGSANNNLVDDEEYNGEEEEEEEEEELEEDDDSELGDDEFFHDDSLASTIRRLKRNARSLNNNRELNSTRKNSTQSDIVMGSSDRADLESKEQLEMTPVTLRPELVENG